MKISIDDKQRAINSDTGELVYRNTSYGTRYAMNRWYLFNQSKEFRTYLVLHCGLPYTDDYKVRFKDIPGEKEDKAYNLRVLFDRVRVENVEISDIENMC